VPSTDEVPIFLAVFVITAALIYTD